jgi:hypothetical protein
MSQDTPPYYDFLRFFCLVFAGKISEAAMLGAGVGGNYIS